MARTSAAESAIVELVNMVCVRCAVIKDLPRSFMKANIAKNAAAFYPTEVWFEDDRGLGPIMVAGDAVIPRY